MLLDLFTASHWHGFTWQLRQINSFWIRKGSSLSGSSPPKCFSLHSFIVKLVQLINPAEKNEKCIFNCFCCWFTKLNHLVWDEFPSQHPGELWEQSPEPGKGGWSRECDGKQQDFPLQYLCLVVWIKPSCETIPWITPPVMLQALPSKCRLIEQPMSLAPRSPGRTEMRALRYFLNGPPQAEQLQVLRGGCLQEISQINFSCFSFWRWWHQHKTKFSGGNCVLCSFVPRRILPAEQLYSVRHERFLRPAEEA